MNLRFRVRKPEREVREFHFDRDSVTVGRGPMNDVIVDDDGVGRRQGELRLDDGVLSWKGAPCGSPTALVRQGSPVEESEGDDACSWTLAAGDVLRLGEPDRAIAIEILEAAAGRAQEPTFVPLRDDLPRSDEAARLLEAMDALAATLDPVAVIQAIGDLLEQRGFEACRAAFVFFSGNFEYLNDTFVLADGGGCRKAPDPLAVLGAAMGTIEDEWKRRRCVAHLDGVIALPFGEPEVAAALVLRVPEASDELLDFAASVVSWLSPVVSLFVKHRELAREHEAAVEENRYLRSRQRQHYLFKELVCESEAMVRVHEKLQRHRATDRPVLLVGEAGTGKELLARVLHHSGSRRDKMFIRVSCAEYADERANFELFGSAPESDVEAPRKGVFELVRGGTVFLEEIDLLPTMVQAKLVRTLKESEVRRVGESVGRRVDARLIASIHRDLDDSVASGRLRRDLYLLLKDQMIVVPPLRERTADLMPLARNFLDVYASRYGLPRSEFSESAIQALQRYAWPGNVRELQARVESAALDTRGETIEAATLGL